MTESELKALQERAWTILIERALERLRISKDSRQAEAVALAGGVKDTEQ